MNREEKSAAIEEIAAQIEGAEAIFAVDYRGISVSQAAELRAKLREADASFRVVKNRLTKLAAEKAKEERLEELLEGPTALTFVRGDTASAAKAVSTFGREHDLLAFKGGFMGELLLDEEQFRSIARLPSREVLDGQLAGVVASPLTGLVRGLGSMVQGLALQLGQIAEKGLVSGDSSAGPVTGDDSSSSQDAGEEPSPAPPAEDSAEAGQAGMEAEEKADEPGAGEETSDDETPAAPGREADEVAADGEAESPSEEESSDEGQDTSEEPSNSEDSAPSEEGEETEQGDAGPPAADAEQSKPAEDDDETSKQEE
jgi:large subunit ribosomal protein L10